MIHLLTAENRVLYAPQVCDLHRARKRVFIDELGWDLALRDGGEFDEYDDDRAMCGVGFDADGRVAMNGRFRPTEDGKSMLVDHFSHALWSDVGRINGADTWEISRSFSLEPGNRRHNLRRQAACMMTPLEVAHAGGAERLVGFADLSIFPFVATMGWRIAFLGDPISYGQGNGAAFMVEVSADAIAEMRASWRLPDPCHLFLAPDMLGATPPLVRAAELALENPELGSLGPRREIAPRATRGRLPGRHNRPAPAPPGRGGNYLSRRSG